MGLPNTTFPSDSYKFLGYHEDQPHLQFVHPATGERVPVTVQPGATSSALDNMQLRDGWINMNSNKQVWSLSLPIESAPCLIASSFRAIPGSDPSLIWVCPTASPGTAALIDQYGAVVETGLLPDDCALDAVFGDRWLVLRMGDGHTLVSGPAGEIAHDLGVGSVQAVNGTSVVMKRHSGGPLFIERNGKKEFNPDRYFWYTILDIESLAERRLGDERSPGHVSSSPNGRHLVVNGNDDIGSDSIIAYDMHSGDELLRRDGFSFLSGGCWSHDSAWYFFHDFVSSNTSAAWAVNVASLELVELPSNCVNYGVDVTELALPLQDIAPD